jgi:RNase H-like domain found in reverse transcriptase
MPFIVTTDGCKEGFMCVLAQQSAHTKPDRMVVQKQHPITFTSKHTSPTEAKYKLFLLKFTALKFTLNKFSDIIWGFPVEIETDCQALKDTLLSEKPSAVYTWWWDSILAHQIIDMWHVPRKVNVVADGLSRQWEDQVEQKEDGHEWTVNPDRDEAVGLMNDILLTQKQEPKKEVQALKECLKDEHLFIEVIDAITAQDSAKMVRDWHQACHRASQYILEGGKLWKLHGGTSTRV